MLKHPALNILYLHCILANASRAAEDDYPLIELRILSLVRETQANACDQSQAGSLRTLIAASPSQHFGKLTSTPTPRLAACSRLTLSGLRKVRCSSIKCCERAVSNCIAFIQGSANPTYSSKVLYPAVPSLVLDGSRWLVSFVTLFDHFANSYHPKTASPFLNLLTASPTSTTMPEASQPRTAGQLCTNSPVICM